ncbi:TP53-binding protein 1 [Chanos chanos]|uniref:TP53-binding protein 1 n=1 Tax=Chanos chanos TaxID=29144 RepID=A0A6J2X0H2_CHACN|nr:TP53-binding protein 1 [Chanos chanos]
MDPGGSDLELSLPQTENPCLIVEDSQPDSVALEDDPDSSYRALLARRLSNLQPTAQSPVLELISSPVKSRSSDNNSQRERRQDIDTVQTDNFSSAALEHSQVLEVCSVRKSRVEASMESGVHSTTQCAQSEDGLSQFGLLALSQSQTQEEIEATPSEMDSCDQPKPRTVESKSPPLASEGHDSKSRRSEVSSSSPSRPGSSREMSIHSILHSQASDEHELMSSQDDLFDGENDSPRVDSTVCEAENPPTCTPANSLRLLHFSGQKTLVQESLSQQSVEFVAATQDRLSQTPFIVPSSPTGQDDEQGFDAAVDSPMDTSCTPEDQSHKREDEPMDMDPTPKSQPTTSTRVSQDSPGLALEKNPSLPSQPEFSHDVFMPTQSQDAGSNSVGPETIKRNTSDTEKPSAVLQAGSPKQTAPVEKHKTVSATTTQPSEPAESFQLELSVSSEKSVFTEKTQTFMVEEDSQATQIESEGPMSVDGSDAVHSQKTGKNRLHPEPTTNSSKVSQVPNLNTSASEKEEFDCSLMELSEKQCSGSLNIQTTNVSEKNKSQVSHQDVRHTSKPPSSQPATKSTGIASTYNPASLPSQSLSQSVIPVALESTGQIGKGQSQSQPLPQSPSQQKYSQTASPSRSQTTSHHRSEIASPSHSQTTSQRRSETASPSHSQTTSPRRSETASPSHSQTTSPRRSEIASPSRSQTTSHHRSETASPSHSQTTSQRRSETASPSHSQTTSQRRSEIASPSRSQTTSQRRSETASPSHSQTTSPRRSEIASPSHSQTTSPRRSETASPSRSQTTSPRRSEIASLSRSQTTSQCHGQTASPTRSQTGSNRQSQTGSQHQSEAASLSQRQTASQRQSQIADGCSSEKEKEEEEEEKMIEGETLSITGTEGSRLCLALSESQRVSPEPMEEGETSQPYPSGVEDRREESFSVIMLDESERVSQQTAEAQHLPQGPGKMSQGDDPEQSSDSQRATLSRPDSQRTINNASKSLSESSGEIPFHFTLPKEGELIGPAVSATPPMINQLKKTPRHSTPIEMASFSERSEGDVTTETMMADSEISVEESREELAAGADGKLSLRMKLVTPVEEVSSGSEHFSLQKPPLSDEESSVSKVTTVSKAVTSSSVFSRVREAHRQVQMEEIQPSANPLRGVLSQQRDSEDDLTHQSQTHQTASNTDNAGAASQSEVSPTSQTDTVGTANRPRASVPSPLIHTNGTALECPSTPPAAGQTEREQREPSASEQTPVRQKAVSQQTSFDLPTATSPPSGRAASQQISFDVLGAQQTTNRGDPDTPSRPPGPSLRRHIRTIQETRTTVTRIITDVYYENGQEVSRTVTEESEEPAVDCRVLDSDISPSRSGTPMTSGDLADISSLSSKGSHHNHSSSSGGLGPVRAPEFIVPLSRGARTASPGRGGRVQQRSQFVGVSSKGTVVTPVSPRGRARRGRPPSRSTPPRGGRSGQGERSRGQPISSSEEENFTRVCPRVPVSPGRRSATSRSDSLNTSPDSSAGASSFVGLRVVAKWSSNGYFYSGSITCDLGESRFRLLFDDGYECEVPGRDILLCDPIPVDTEVTALNEDEYFTTGIVKGHKTEGRELLYCVEKDGQSKWYGRRAVILSVEQGNRLREQFGLAPYEPTTPHTMASDISLDNLVEGKRRRRGNTAGSVTPNRNSSSSPRTPGPSGKRKLISPAEDQQTPAKRAHKTGRNKTGLFVSVEQAKCNTSGSGTDLPSDPSSVVATHGPMPDSATLFMGFAFLLTASSETDRESNVLNSDGEEEYVQTAPYNKRYTESQLETGGGFILQEFNEEQCKAAYQSLLIADQYCRSRKYLLCLAGGVPCVSHIWVRDCCQEKKLLNYRNYLLPAGVGPGGHIVEWHPRATPFKALRVLLVLDESVDLWTELLRMGGTATVKQHRLNKDSSDIPADKFDVLVTVSACPAELLQRVRPLQVPVVSLEWLIQSVISGERQNYGSKPEYRHDYSP